MNLLFVGLILLVLVAIFWSSVKAIFSKAANVLINSVAGLLILLVLNLVFGWKIPISLITLLICGLFGIPGVATLVILYFFDML
jgi:pro-sigmaK processing inhibitor BofA